MITGNSTAPPDAARALGTAANNKKTAQITAATRRMTTPFAGIYAYYAPFCRDSRCMIMEQEEIE
jgi:hypothetical protein